MRLPLLARFHAPATQTRRFWLLGCVALFALEASARTQSTLDPRWTLASSASSAWVPGTVTFAGRDQWVWGQTGGATQQRLLLASASQGSAQPSRACSGYPAWSRPFASASAARPDRLFAIDQDNPQAPGGSRFWMRAYDPWSGTSGGSMAPAWSHELSSTPIGTCLLGTDRQGDVVVAAALVQGGVELMARSGTSGALLLHLWMSGLTLDALEVSADGSTIAIATGLTLRVFDAFGLTVHSETLTSSVASLALSGDGSVLAAAQSGGTRVLERASAGYVLARFLSADASAPNQALSAKVDLSDDGAALAVAHWRYTNGPRATLEFWDLTANALLWQQVEQQTNGGLQILPTAARISRDGQRAAFATWGDATQPEVLWVDRSDPAHWRAFDLPGSALALDMDARGERLVVAHKATHAQIFASTGAVLLLDAAPACLALEAPLTSSGVLAVSGFHPGASWALFLVGPKGTSSAIGGVSGSLLLQRSRLAVWAAPIDPFGRATMQWPLPLSWVGPELPFAVQVGFRTPAGTLLSPELLEPLLLR